MPRNLIKEYGWVLKLFAYFIIAFTFYLLYRLIFRIHDNGNISYFIISSTFLLLLPFVITIDKIYSKHIKLIEKFIVGIICVISIILILILFYGTILCILISVVIGQTNTMSQLGFINYFINFVLWATQYEWGNHNIVEIYLFVISAYIFLIEFILIYQDILNYYNYINANTRSVILKIFRIIKNKILLIFSQLDPADER